MNAAEIFVYPIKSFRGSAVNEAGVCGYGLEHDRQWMVDGNSPLLVIRQTSLDALNRRLPTPVHTNRFRPNLVVSDSKPFEEDLRQRISVGDVALRAVN